jgi:hypothetical protein
MHAPDLAITICVVAAGYGRRWGLVLFLLVIGVGCIGAAWLIYPRLPTTAAPGSPIVTFQTDGPIPQHLVVSVLSGSGDGTTTLNLEVDRYNLAAKPSPVAMYVRLPQGAVVTRCDGATCDHASAPRGFGPTVHVSNARFLPVGPVTDGLREWSAVAGLSVRAQGFVWSASDVNAEADLPAVRLMVNGRTITAPDSTTGDPEVYTDLTFPGATSYDWVGGPPPESQPLGAVQWDQTIAATSNLVGVSGVNRSEQRWADFRLFLAGILAGIGGGAVVGAITEAWDS